MTDVALLQACHGFLQYQSVTQSITQSINQDLIQVDKPQEDRVKLMHMLK